MDEFRIWSDRNERAINFLANIVKNPTNRIDANFARAFNILLGAPSIRWMEILPNLVGLSDVERVELHKWLTEEDEKDPLVSYFNGNRFMIPNIIIGEEVGKELRAQKDANDDFIIIRTVGMHPIPNTTRTIETVKSPDDLSGWLSILLTSAKKSWQGGGRMNSRRRITRTKGRTGGRTKGRTGGRTKGRTRGRTKGRTGGRTKGRTGGRTRGRRRTVNK